MVVSVRSAIEGLARSMETRVSRSARTSGSPPVRRTLLTPRLVKTPARRVISSKVRISARGRNA